MMVNSYSFKRFSSDTMDDFCHVYEMAKKKKMDINWILKKFNTQQYGMSNVGFIAYSPEGEPIAFLGVIPVKIIYNNDTLWAAQLVEGMTHPEYRNKGLFKMLILKICSLSSELEIKFLFGFPNKNSFPAFLKLEWEVPFYTKQYSSIIKLSYWSRFYKKIKPISFYNNRLKKLNELNIPIDQFLTQKPQFASDNIYIERGAELLAYKTYSKSFILKLINGFVWMKNEGDIFYIGDIFPNNDNIHTLNQLLSDIKEIAQNLCFSRILLYISPNSIYNLVLEKEWTQTDSLPLIIKKTHDNFEFDIKTFEYTSADFDTF